MLVWDNEVPATPSSVVVDGRETAVSSRETRCATSSDPKTLHVSAPRT